MTDRTIIIIEDNPNSARLAQKLLSRAEYAVEIAEDGETGYTVAMESDPDLILIDLGLPDIDGQTIIAMLKQQPNMQQTPIIAFTAYPAATAQEMAKAYGCDGVIVKPIDTRTFVEQVVGFMRSDPAS